MKRARLLYGPYDGDRGYIDWLAPRVWAFECPACGDIHWAERYDDLPNGERGAPYDLDETGQDEKGYHVYIWADLLDSPLTADEREVLTA